MLRSSGLRLKSGEEHQENINSNQEVLNRHSRISRIFGRNLAVINRRVKNGKPGPGGTVDNNWRGLKDKILHPFCLLSDRGSTQAHDSGFSHSKTLGLLFTAAKGYRSILK